MIVWVHMASQEGRSITVHGIDKDFMGFMGNDVSGTSKNGQATSRGGKEYRVGSRRSVFIKCVKKKAHNICEGKK